MKSIYRKVIGYTNLDHRKMNPVGQTRNEMTHVLERVIRRQST